MRIKITRTTVAAKAFVRAGSVVDLDDYEARTLINMGKAEAFDGAVEPPVSPMTTEDAEPLVETKRKRGRPRAAG